MRVTGASGFLAAGLMLSAAYVGRGDLTAEELIRDADLAMYRDKVSRTTRQQLTAVGITVTV